MPVHHGGHRSGGVLGVFLAKPLVLGTPAGAGGRAWPVELPDPARHDGDSERQPYPPDARRQFARRLRPAVHQGVGEHCRRRWLVGVPAPGLLIALDGTEHFGSRKIGCPQCSTRRRSDGGTEYFHSFLGASVVAPGHAQVLPLPAEFIMPQDGTEKQDCERAAAKRWLARHGAGVARFRPVYLGDDLHACQPIVQAIQESDGSFILTCSRARTRPSPNTSPASTSRSTGRPSSSAAGRPPASIAGSPRSRCAAPPMP